MKIRKLFFVGAALAALLLTVGVAACTPAQVKAYEGMLQNVDSVSGNVSVTLKDGTTQTFNLQDVNVEAVRQAIGSASLETGAPVTVESDKDGKVKTLKVHAANVEGLIKSLDQGKQTLTITTEKQKEVTLNVTANTSIKIANNNVPTFADLKDGQRVEAKYNVDTLNATVINAGSGKVQNGGEAKNSGEAKGSSEARNSGEPKSRGESEDRDENRGSGQEKAKTGAVTAGRTAGNAPRIPHTLQGRENCLSCHGPGTEEQFPANHQGRTNDICLTCHKN